jgi:hypothetical protein
VTLSLFPLHNWAISPGGANGSKAHRGITCCVLFLRCRAERRRTGPAEQERVLLAPPRRLRMLWWTHAVLRWRAESVVYVPDAR